MADCPHIRLFQQREHRLDINLCRGQQAFAKRHAKFGAVGFEVGFFDVKDLAHQREAVGVDAGGGQGDDRVSRLHAAAVQNPGAIHRAAGESGEVIFLLAVKARHLGGLAADERRAGLYTAFGNPRDDVRDPLRDIFAAGDVIQEKQRFCTAGDDVVDAHRDAVDADRVVLVHQKGELEFGADPVGAADQDRPGHAGQVQLKQAAETAKAPDRARGHGARDMLFHQLDRGVSGGDVHTGHLIAFGKTLHLFPRQSLVFSEILYSNLLFALQAGGSIG